MYCRNCGVQEGTDGAMPRIVHTLLLCEECAKLTAVSHRFDPASGAPLDGSTRQPRSHSVGIDRQYWERVGKLIRETIEAVRFPGIELTDPQHYRRIEQRDEDGTIWRGTLYQVRKEHP